MPVQAPESAAAPAASTQQVLFRRDTGGYDCYRIPAIVKTTKGTLLAFAEARKDAPGQSWCDDQADIDLVLRRSTDGGATWGPTIMVSQSDGETHGNPVPIVVETGPSAGRIVLLTTHNPLDLATPRTPYVQYSTAAQDGTAWSAPRNIADQIDDPDWNWSATGPVHGIQLKRGPHPGRLIAGINAEPAGGSPLAGAVYSDDGGTTWTIGGLQPGATSDVKPQEISPIELTDGRIYLAARDTQQTGTWPRSYATSSDGGATLDGPFREIPNVAATRSVQGSTLRLRATDEGDRYNRILFATPVDPDTATNYRRNLTIYSSYNEGSTWTGAKQITADRSGYSDLVETSSGSIGVLYEAGLWSGDARDEIRFARLAESDLGLPEGAAGPTTPDESGNDFDAYVRGGATVGAGKYGQSVLLDCDGDYVQPPYAETLATGSGDFTVTAWFRYGQSTADQAILWAYGQGSTASQLWLRAEPGANRVRAWMQTANGSVNIASRSAYRDDGWHHVSLQRGGGRFVLRIDGVQIGSVAAPAGTISPARPFQIHLGQRLDGANCFDGRLDEVRLYRRALTTTELEAIRNSNSTSVPGAVLRLPFETIGGAATAMNASEVNQQVLFRRGEGGNDCYRIPAIVRTSKGTLLAFAEARKAGASWCNDTGDIDLVVRRSTDGGATWDPPITVSGGDATETHGNPVPIVVSGGRHDGRIVLLTTHNPSTTNTPRTPYVQYSSAGDDGRKWSKPVSLAAAIDQPDWGWYATGPVHGIQLTRGAHAGRLVAGINAGTPEGNIGGLVYSDDAGDTWRLGGTRAGSAGITPQEISPVELSDGRIYLAARNQVPGATWPRAYAVSSDGGATLDAPFAMVPNLAATPRVQGSTLRLRDRILLATPVDPTYRKDLTIYTSADEAATWGSGRQLTTDRSGYSDMVSLGNGRIGVLYEGGAYPDGDARDEIRFAVVSETDLAR
ncbi:hypothetical protein GCM10027569_89200 [Flindersiella endophytica]